MVADLVLDEADQRALRELMSAEPLDQGLAGAEPLLLNLSRLIPCDCLGVGIGDSDGYLLDEVTLPRQPFEGGIICDGPLLLGVHVWSREAEHRELLEAWGLADGVAVGFRGARGLVVQVYLDRLRTPFSSRDLQLLHLVTPTLDRLLTRPAPRLAHGALCHPDVPQRAHHPPGRTPTEDATWTPVLTAPPYPEYPSGHQGVTSAFTGVVACHLGDIPLTLVGATSSRSYSTLELLRIDALNSRIWGGIHFRDAMDDSYVIGSTYARRVCRH